MLVLLLIILIALKIPKRCSVFSTDRPREAQKHEKQAAALETQRDLPWVALSVPPPRVMRHLQRALLGAAQRGSVQSREAKGRARARTVHRRS